MIEAKKVKSGSVDVVELNALPDLVMYEDVACIDELIEKLKCLKPAISDAQSVEMLG